MKRLVTYLLFTTLKRLLTTLILLSVSAYMSGSRGAEASAEGIWELSDDGGKPLGWFKIAEQNGAYTGQIVRTFPTPGEKPEDTRCGKCEGEQKDAPVLGLTFIKGMKRTGLAYEGGRILNPRDGAEYRARMDLSADSQRLQVRGYLAIEMLGQTQVWHRVTPSPETSKLLARRFEKVGK
jgi:uncharacterized protein (DUF2147 family)